MPSNVRKARKDIARAFGTEIIFSDPMEGSDGAIRQVRELVAKDPEKYFYPDQYSNPDNPLRPLPRHGRRDLDALGDRITHFVAGIGTSGTMMGTSRRLHEHTRPIRCVAVEPTEALHGLEGLKHLARALVPAPSTTRAGPTRRSRHHGGGLGHGRPARPRGGAPRRALVRGERLRRGRDRRGAAREQGGGCVVAIVADRGDRYFAPMKWEKKHLW